MTLITFMPNIREYEFGCYRKNLSDEEQGWAFDYRINEI